MRLQTALLNAHKSNVINTCREIGKKAAYISKELGMTTKQFYKLSEFDPMNFYNQMIMRNPEHLESTKEYIFNIFEENKNSLIENNNDYRNVNGNTETSYSIWKPLAAITTAGLIALTGGGLSDTSNSQDAYGYAEEVPCKTFGINPQLDEIWKDIFGEKCLKWDKKELNYYINNKLSPEFNKKVYEVYPEIYKSLNKTASSEYGINALELYPLLNENVYEFYVYGAFDTWNNKTDGLFNFTKVYNPENADIKINLFDVSKASPGTYWNINPVSKINFFADDYKIDSVETNLPLNLVYYHKHFTKHGRFNLHDHYIIFTDSIFSKIAEHEVGHIIGLGHVKGENLIEPIDSMSGIKLEIKDTNLDHIKFFDITMKHEISQLAIDKLKEMYGSDKP